MSWISLTTIVESSSCNTNSFSSCFLNSSSNKLSSQGNWTNSLGAVSVLSGIKSYRKDSGRSSCTSLRSLYFWELSSYFKFSEIRSMFETVYITSGGSSPRTWCFVKGKNNYYRFESTIFIKSSTFIIVFTIFETSRYSIVFLLPSLYSYCSVLTISSEAYSIYFFLQHCIIWHIFLLK